MLNLPLWVALVILAALLACGEQTLTQGGAVATVPATAEGPTSLPSPVTPAAEPTETPQSTPTETTVPSAATTPLPANTPAPEATSETTPAPREESPNKVITPLMLDDPPDRCIRNLGFGTGMSGRDLRHWKTEPTLVTPRGCPVRRNQLIYQRIRPLTGISKSFPGTAGPARPASKNRKCLPTP